MVKIIENSICVLQEKHQIANGAVGFGLLFIDALEPSPRFAVASFGLRQIYKLFCQTVSLVLNVEKEFWEQIALLFISVELVFHTKVV